MNDALNIPGVANSFTMPIKARIDMLATGIRTPVGIKILGPNLEEIEKIGMTSGASFAGCSGNAQRLCGTGSDRLLPGYRHQSRRHCPIWSGRG
ncbi:MAG: hypothetical protein MZU84_07220 [Sphingobacterium sp.]|nr:hypothetical protein [Sphingobacterium sp.]